jgi:multicomponent Na+:H+ antiporter subunit E
MILTLAVAWVLFWGDLSLANLLSGAFLGLLIAVVFPLPPVEFIGRFRFLAPLRLMVRLLADLVVSSITVAGQALRFGRPIRNAIVRVDLRTHSDLYLTLTSELVSLVPGTLVVEARRRESVLYVHVLDVRSPADVDRAHRGALDAEARVLRAFGSAAEVAALDAEQDAERGAR